MGISVAKERLVILKWVQAHCSTKHKESREKEKEKEKPREKDADKEPGKVEVKYYGVEIDSDLFLFILEVCLYCIFFFFLSLTYIISLCIPATYLPKFPSIDFLPFAMLQRNSVYIL